jgi:hypothetical protein
MFTSLDMGPCAPRYPSPMLPGNNKISCTRGREPFLECRQYRVWKHAVSVAVSPRNGPSNTLDAQYRQPSHETGSSEEACVATSTHPAFIKVAALTLALGWWACPEAGALSLHSEPANALSLPTWAVHTSSVIEYVFAMLLIWRYADATGNQKWKGMTWGMTPFLASAMCACTWHFFYNSPELTVRFGHPSSNSATVVRLEN